MRPQILSRSNDTKDTGPQDTTRTKPVKHHGTAHPVRGLCMRRPATAGESQSSDSLSGSHIAAPTPGHTLTDFGGGSWDGMHLTACKGGRD